MSASVEQIPAEAVHTAGPWVANDDHSGEGWRLESDASGYPNDGWILAQFFGPDAEGNARLAAQALRLLVLAEDNLGTLEEQRRRCQRWDKSHCEIDAAIELTRAAIAETRGRELASTGQ